MAVVNLTAVDDELPPEFVVAWGNRSAQVTLQELQDNEGACFIITLPYSQLFSCGFNFRTAGAGRKLDFEKLFLPI